MIPNVAFPANDKAVDVATLSNADVAVDASANNTAANDAFPVNGEAADAAIMSNTDMAADADASPANDAAAEIANAANVVICIVSISVLFVFDLPFVVKKINLIRLHEQCIEQRLALKILLLMLRILSMPPLQMPTMMLEVLFLQLLPCLPCLLQYCTLILLSALFHLPRKPKYC